MENSRIPKAGKDYPQTWIEFLEWFHSEEACLGYLERIRWPSGFVCPRCGVAEDAYRCSRSRLICPACQYGARSLPARGLLFYRLLEQAVASAPMTYEVITGHGSD